MSTPDPIIREVKVRDLCGISHTTIWRLERDGKFPRRVSIVGNLVGWRLSEVLAWMESRKPVDLKQSEERAAT